MIHPHYIFWFVAPALLTLTWYVLRRSSRPIYALAVLLTAATVFLPQADLSRPFERAELIASLIVAGSPFLGVLIVTMAAWNTLRRTSPWVAPLAIPLSYYIGFTAGVTIGMMAGVVRS